MSESKKQGLNPSKYGWVIEWEPGAVDAAMREIRELYPAQPGQKDMLGWLDRFLEALDAEPMNVLGFPPRQVASDPDMMYFPGDPSAKISGVAHVSKNAKKIHVFKILVQAPKEAGHESRVHSNAGVADRKAGHPQRRVKSG